MFEKRKINKNLNLLFKNLEYFIISTNNGVAISSDKNNFKKSIKKIFRNLEHAEINLTKKELEELLEEIKKEVYYEE